MTNEATVRAMAEALPAAVIRAKGLIATPSGAFVFQRVGERWSLVPIDQPLAESQLVAIGVPEALDGAWLTAHLGPGTNPTLVR